MQQLRAELLEHGTDKLSQNIDIWVPTYVA